MIKKRKALTLFELLVVMIAFSILISFVVPLFSICQKEALRGRIDGDLDLLRAALKVYLLSHNTCPDPDIYQEELRTASPQVLDRQLIDPFSGSGDSAYSYGRSPNGRYFIVYSVGALGNVSAEVSDQGKVVFLTGDPEYEKWVSNGTL